MTHLVRSGEKKRYIAQCLFSTTDFHDIPCSVTHCSDEETVCERARNKLSVFHRLPLHVRRKVEQRYPSDKIQRKKSRKICEYCVLKLTSARFGNLGRPSVKE